MNCCLNNLLMDSSLCPDVRCLPLNLRVCPGVSGSPRGASKRLNFYPTLSSNRSAGPQTTSRRAWSLRDGSRLSCSSTNSHHSLNSVLPESPDKIEAPSPEQDVVGETGTSSKAESLSKSPEFVNSQEEDLNANKDVGFPVDEVSSSFLGKAEPPAFSKAEDQAVLDSVGVAMESSRHNISNSGEARGKKSSQVLEQLTATFSDLDSALGDINSSVKQLNFSPNESRVFSSPDEVSSMPEEVNFSSHHPYDPHKPSFSPLLPEAYRPYPSFEGWFIRLLDPEKRLSVGLIMATNYATNESQVTLLYCPSTWLEPDLDNKSVKDGASDATAGDGETELPGYDSKTDPTQAPVKTIAVAVMTKEARFSQRQHTAEDAEKDSSIAGFEWEAPGLGKITAKPHETDIDVTVQGYHFTTHLTDEILWNEKQSEAGPEGWARKVPLFPTHWYVYSLGSKASYQLSNPELGINEEGTGYAHQEKNWGETFPAGHVWVQAMSLENDAQLVLSGAYFLGPGGLKLPYVFAGGIRSQKLNLDLRTNDPGTVFKDFKVSPLDGYFEVTAVTSSHTVLIKSTAPPYTFSNPVLAPIGKLDWKPACRETYLATAEVEVQEHSAWGVIGERKLVEKLSFSYAALEFGEDLLEQAQKRVEEEEELRSTELTAQS